MTEKHIEELTAAAELLYTYVDPKKGFYSGIWEDEKTGKKGPVWNNFTGASKELSDKLGRQLTKAEITILSLAIGFGPTPCLCARGRADAFEMLWSRVKPDQRAGTFAPLMQVLISFY